MNIQPPAPGSFRQLIHDMNQIIFLLRGHCELGLGPDPQTAVEHLRDIQDCLSQLDSLAKRLKQKQLELAPDE